MLHNADIDAMLLKVWHEFESAYTSTAAQPRRASKVPGVQASLQAMQNTAQDILVLNKIAQHLENVSPTELRPHMRLGSKRSCTDRQDIDPPRSQDQKDPGTQQTQDRSEYFNKLCDHALIFVSPSTQDTSARAMRHSTPSLQLEGGFSQQETNLE